MKKKLLSIAPHMSTGGGPQVLVKRIELIKDYYEVYVIEYRNISQHYVIQKNRIKQLVDNDKFFTLGDDKTELFTIINRINPDIIHLEEIPEMFMEYEISTRLYNSNRRYKIFETTHSSDYNVDNKMFFPDKFIFVSQYNCFKFNRFGVPIDVVEYPIENKKRLLSKKKLSMLKLGLDPEYKHVLNVGLFTPRKNQAYAFEIARQLTDKKIKFHFVGNQAGNFQHYWEPLMKNKPDNCIIWGERKDVDDFYKSCDIFLFTSMGFRFDKELNPLVIKEALEYKIPQFLFPLDVYCGKYDKEKLITYLSGDIRTDSETVYNFNDFKFDSEKQDFSKDLYFQKVETKPIIKTEEKIIPKNTDEIFILSTYPDTEIKSDITKECIKSIKKHGKKIILSSHIPVDREIQNMVDYYIYDNYNPLIEHSLYKNYWYETNEFRADIIFDKIPRKNKLNQSLTVLNNIENSVQLASSLGYTRVINVTYDYIFSDEDINKIDSISKGIDVGKKSGYFMKFSDNKLDVFKTVFFIIDIDLYKNTFTNPRTPEKFNEECKKLDCDNFLERYFYKKLENKLDKIFIQETTEDEIFTGKINIFSGVEYLTYLKVKDKNSFVVWFSSNNVIDNRKLIVNYIVDGNAIKSYEREINNKIIFNEEIEIKEDNIVIETRILDSNTNKLLEEETFGPINKDNFDDLLSNRGTFENKIKKTIKLGTVINYNTNLFNSIKKVIDSVKSISTVVNISTCDCFFDGTKEDEDLLNRTYEENHKDNVNFIVHEFNNSVNKDDQYWENISRLLGVKYMEGQEEWILLLNGNEKITDGFKNWVMNNDLSNDAYLFSDKDSPLLIKKNLIDFYGDRTDIISKVEKKILNLESHLFTKCYEKIY